MRSRFLIAAALTPTLAGCRPPAIPTQPSSTEYTVYGAWLDQASSKFAPSLNFAVDATTLTPNQNEFQFQQCLPRRMQGLLSGAPSATLTSTSAKEWLNLSSGRTAHLRPPSSPLSFDHPTEWIRLSRVAFTMSGYDAYLWIEHRTCGRDTRGCSEGEGTLVHGQKSEGEWTFEDTVCQAFLPARPSQI